MVACRNKPSLLAIGDILSSLLIHAHVGFPLNTGSDDSLITKFAFVDRAMNPIGDDVVINAESLIEMSQDYDLSMFQVFSRLLSINGFEFFPLQNFMSFNNKNGNWSEAFQIFTTLEQKPTPAFVIPRAIAVFELIVFYRRLVLHRRSSQSCTLQCRNHDRRR